MKQKPKEIFAILPVRNRKNITLSCIASLKELIIPDGYVLHIIVVDDASTDGTVQAIIDKYPDILIIEGDGSLYWGGGICAGMKLAQQKKGDFIWWLNDDLEVTKTCLCELISASESNKKGIYVGVVLDDCGVPIYGGIKRKSFFVFSRQSFSE